MTADGNKITFKGPGQWRSQADAAQAPTRPPAAALEPPTGKRRVASRSRDLTDEHRLVLAEIARCGGWATSQALRSRRIIDGWDFSLGAALSVLVRVGLVVQTGDGDAVSYHLAEGGDIPFDLSRAGWDPAKHPRIAHGHGGGQFARETLAGGGPVRTPKVPDTQSRYKRADGTYLPARQRLHDEIVRGLLAGGHPQAHPVVRFYGGGPASGKSVTLHPLRDSVTLDADAVKPRLPEYGQGLKAGRKDAAVYVHEESSDIARQAEREAMTRRFNVTMDGMGDTSVARMTAKLAAARQAGYQVDGQYVTVDTDEAIRRATARAAATGRMVPASVIRQAHQNVSQVLPQLIVQDAFDSLQLWDNNGSRPTLIGEKPRGGSWAVRDETAWQRFLAKGRPGG